MDFGSRLKQLRELSGLSQSELARRAKITPAMIVMIENGKRPNPSLGTVRKLASGLGITIGLLAGDEIEAVSAA